MRWLITGATGMVGSEVRQQLRKRDEDTIAVGHGELDVTDRGRVLDLAESVRPDVIVNSAAFTKVDQCEKEEELAERVNATAVGFLADAANVHDAILVHISTDFVFDGSKQGEWSENDSPAPLSAYGRTKLHGETAAAAARRHLIVRSSWIFGSNGPNFVNTIARQIEKSGSSGPRVHGSAEAVRELRVVDDQRGRPTWAPHLASVLIDLATRATEDASVRGLVHYADAPACTWFDFAREIVRLRLAIGGIDAEVTVRPVPTSEFPRPAVRPANSALSTVRYESITGNAPGSWLEGLEEYLRLRELDRDPMA